MAKERVYDKAKKAMENQRYKAKLKKAKEAMEAEKAMKARRLYVQQRAKAMKALKAMKSPFAHSFVCIERACCVACALHSPMYVHVRVHV